MIDPADLSPSFDIAPSVFRGEGVARQLLKFGIAGAAVITGLRSEDPVAMGLLAGIGLLLMLSISATALSRLDRIAIGPEGLRLVRRGRDRRIEWSEIATARLECGFGMVSGVRWRFTLRDGNGLDLRYVGMSHQDWQKLSRAVLSEAAAAGVRADCTRFSGWLFGLSAAV